MSPRKRLRGVFKKKRSGSYLWTHNDSKPKDEMRKLAVKKLEFWHFYKYQYECIPHKYVLEFFGICFIAL